MPLPHEDQDPLGLGCAQAARRSGKPIDAARFVLDALAYAHRYIDRAEPGCHVRGWVLCTAVARYAREVFGPEAAEVLRGWGLETCEDVGLVAAALVDANLMRTSYEDSLADFAGRGRLSDLMG